MQELTNPAETPKTFQKRLSLFLLCSFVALFFTAPSFAGTNVGVSYQGRILRPSGEAVNAGVVAFSLRVFDPTNNCLLWSEVQNVNMAGTSGAFSLVVGAGTRTDGGAHTLKQVFTNAGTLSSLTCTSGTTYAPTANEDRNLSVTFNDGGTVVALSTMAIKSAPFALQADQVSGYGILNLAKISGAGSATTLTPFQFDFLAALAAPASASSTPCAANDILKFVGGVWTCSADATGGAPGDASYAAKGTVQFDTDAATSGVSVAAGVATINTGIAANQIPKLDASANLGVGIAPGTRLDVNGAITQRGMAAPAVSAAGTGRIYYDSTTNHFYYSENGGGYTQLSSATGALSSVSSISNAAGDITLAPITTTGAVLVSSGTPSIGSASGALVVTGGIGASGSIYTGGSINAGTTMTAATSIYSPQLYGYSTASGDIKIDGTSHATKGNVLLASAGGKVGIGAVTPTSPLTVAGAGEFVNNNFGSTSTDGVVIANMGDSAPGIQQMSPRLRFHGSGWNTTSSASREVDAWFEVPSHNTSAGGTYTAFQLKLAIDGTPVSATALMSDNYGNLSSHGSISTSNSGGFTASDGYLRAYQNTTTTPIDGLLVSAGSAASVGTPVRMSPRLRLRSQVWDTGAGANRTSDWAIEDLPTSGNPASSLLRIGNSWNGAAYTYPMVISSSGNVGIGTTNPTRKFVVLDPRDGRFQASFSDSTDTYGIGITANDSSANLGPMISVRDAGVNYRSSLTLSSLYDQPIIFSTNYSGGPPYTTATTSERMRLDNTGLGIGAISPNSALDVNGAINQRGMAAPALSAAGQGKIYFDSTANKFKVSQDGGAYADLVGGSGGSGFSSLTGATGISAIDNTNYAQTWAWSTATTQSPMALTANALTTGTILNVTTSSASLNSTSGLLNVANTGASTNGMIARIQSNSTAGSGITVLANGRVGIGTTTPGTLLDVAGVIQGTVFSGDIWSNSIMPDNAGATLDVQGGNSLSWAGTFLQLGANTYTATSGNLSIVKIAPIYNEASGTASNTDLLINRTETAIGSGSQYLADFQVGGSSKFVVTNTGKVGIGTTSPSSPLSVGDGSAKDGTIMALGYGTVGTDGQALGVSGAGTRMFWYPKKAAFRSGNVNGTQWDDANIGLYSVSMGQDTKASGANSIHIGGGGNGATGTASVALGWNNGATGNYSTAIGTGAYAGASGALALGTATTAAGSYSHAYGTNVSTNGNNSMSFAAGFSSATFPQVSGANSFGFFMGDQAGVNVTTSNVMSIMGGNVGIGTVAPAQKLEVAGSINVGSQTSRTTASTNRGQLGLSSTYVQTANASTTVDWNNGNIQEINTLACDGAKTITMTNARDGAAYTLLLSGTAAHSGTCLFSAAGLTFKVSGGAQAPTASKDVLFTFVVINNIVVYNMVDNLQ